MDFDTRIEEYRQNSNQTSSPIWIWFKKAEQKDVNCQICQIKIHRKDFSTGQMTQHLQRHHHFLTKYNAWKIYEELSALKQQRMSINNRKRKMADSDEGKPSKQPKMTDIAKFSRDDPRQIKITNSIASMVCTDGVATNIVSREGFKNVMNSMEPRYKLPNYSTFSRSIIPKLKNAVTSFQKNKAQ